MFQSLSNYISEIIRGKKIRLGGKEAQWKKVSELKVGAKIAITDKNKVVFDEIVSIKKVGRKQVYDIEVEGSHNFVGNGILAHNTYIMSGNVGIGTTAPTALLDVAGDASTSGSLVFNGTNKSIDILNGSRLDFQVSPGGDLGLTQAMTIDNAGRVGIGTTGPSSKLDITGTGTFSAAGVSVLNAGAHTVTLSASPDTFRAVQIGAMTLTAGSAQTVATASSLYIDTPVAGTNITITNNKPIDTATGAYLSSAGVWTDVSGYEYKENFATLDLSNILGKIGELPIQSWNYKTDGLAIKHIGPVADDFYKIFGVGNDDKHLAALDTSGIALAGVKGILERLDNGYTKDQKNLDMTVLGKLETQGAVTFKGEAFFEQKSIFQALAEFIGDAIFKGKVAFLSPPTFPKDTGGRAVIKSQTTTVEVTFEKVYEYTPVVTTTLGSPVRLDWYRIKGLTAKGFIIEISPALSQDTEFTWIALAVAGNETHASPTPTAIPTTPTAALTPTAIPSPTTVPSSSPSPTLEPTPTATPTQ